MITLSIAGQAADHIDGTGMAQGSEDAEEILIRRYWDGATIRRYGKGYRLTMTAPAWVWAWILDSLDALMWSDDLTDAEHKAYTATIKAIRDAGADSAGAVTRQELEEAGLVEPEAAPVAEVAPVAEEAPQAPAHVCDEEAERAAYSRYVSDGIGDTDGWFIPEDFDAWRAHFHRAIGHQEPRLAECDTDGAECRAPHHERTRMWQAGPRRNRTRESICGGCYDHRNARRLASIKCKCDGYTREEHLAMVEGGYPGHMYTGLY
jgi:hypothetical protein